MSNEIHILKAPGSAEAFRPAVVQEVRWETRIAGAPGLLEFTIYDDGNINFPEGANVQFFSDGTPIFNGFLFERERTKDHLVRCLAYDQLRYLKQEEPYVYVNKTATEVIKMIAEDYRLQIGELADTKYKIPARNEMGVSMWECILQALGITHAITTERFVLYDDFGKLVLKNIKDMQLKMLIEKDNLEDFRLLTSINNETANAVKIIINNPQTAKRENYIINDEGNIGKWGLLKFYKEIQYGMNGTNYAQMQLSLRNIVSRDFSLKGIRGEPTIRAGNAMTINLEQETGMKPVQLVADRVLHRFSGDDHSMDIDFINPEMWHA